MLDDLLATPSNRLIYDIKKITGDILILGAGGKMGPSLCLLAKRAVTQAGSNSRIIAVSRFSDPYAVSLLEKNGIDIISADLMDKDNINNLPDVPNVIYMAGRKFGTDESEYLTWGTNVWLSSRIAEKYKNSRLTVFSTGNIYPQVSIHSNGATETTSPIPVGEYAMSALGRERMFEYAAHTYGTEIALYRLNYSVDLRYGVIFDIAEKIINGTPISLEISHFNCIWQNDANEMAIRCLLHADSDVFKINVTGIEKIPVRETALKLGNLLGREPIFTGEPTGFAYLSDSSKMAGLFGVPAVNVETLIQWQAEWIKSGGRSLGKATHFEESRGKY